jgi:peptidoglycan/xylan/chitin deacetylase (PgdA/CDA1 family)
MYRSNETARKALPLVIAGLQKRGFRLVTVSELLAPGQPVGR